ncbi:MAG: hypothetical protein HKN23_02635 [Verrucomicrobiales bacterium]|nr:hypothetical protein [Verrucomicrobiales bacterium]
MNLRIIPALVALLSLVPLAFAALPITAIKDLQKKAPDQVVIEVLDSKTNEKKVSGAFYFYFDVKAKITAIDRSASGLKIGDEIRIKYSRPNIDKTPAAGDWAGGVDKGKSYTAHLKPVAGKAGNFDPAAASGTFVEVKKKP